MLNNIIVTGDVTIATFNFYLGVFFKLLLLLFYFIFYIDYL